jgi:hypothetical protein
MDCRQSLHNRHHHHDIGNKTPKIEFIPTSVWNRHWLFALTYLMQIPLDVLKIAKSFIDDVSNLQDDRERLPPLLLMGHILGFKLLAEAFVPLLRDQTPDVLCSFTQ